MSLINDALKRAKEVHQQTPPAAPDLPFRPVDPSQRPARQRRGVLLPVVLIVLAIALLCGGWIWQQQRRAEAAEVAARTPDVPAGVAQMLEPRPVAVPNANPPQPAAVTTVTDAPPAQVTSQPINTQAVAQASAPVTNTPPAVAPDPPPLRLQAILFSPSRPSAIISGKTVYVGDRVRDLKVAAIDKDSTTLISASQTNILSLAH